MYVRLTSGVLADIELVSRCVMPTTLNKEDIRYERSKSGNNFVRSRVDTQRASINYSTKMFPALRRVLAKEGIEGVGSSRIQTLKMQL